MATGHDVLRALDELGKLGHGTGIVLAIKLKNLPYISTEETVEKARKQAYEQIDSLLRPAVELKELWKKLRDLCWRTGLFHDSPDRINWQKAGANLTPEQEDLLQQMNQRISALQKIVYYSETHHALGVFQPKIPT